MKQETIFIKLKLLSPVHLGCGEDYEPTGFVINGDELVSFSPLEFISSLDNDAKREFSELCSRGDIASLLEIYRFMNRHSSRVAGRRVTVCAGLQEHYQETLALSSRNRREIQSHLNQFRIERTASQSFDGIPYIPGTAVKGAMRTALLNRRKPEHQIHIKSRNKWAGQDLEKQIFGGSFSTDPMRLVKISDFIALGKPRTRIVYAVNRKKRPSRFEPSAPYQIVEVVEPGVEFIGSITVFAPDRKRGQKELPDHPPTFPELHRALNDFYRTENQRENLELRNIGLQGIEIAGDSGRLPLRLGRHSGAECLTIAGYREIKIKGRGREFKTAPQATTLWLAAEYKKPKDGTALRPFGWVAAEELSAEQFAAGRAEIIGRLRQREDELAEVARQLQQEAAELAARERETAERQAREEAARRAEEAEQQALQDKWDSLSEEERDIEKVLNTELAQAIQPGTDVIAAVWPKIDAVDPDHRLALARAFKTRWEREGKWKVSKKKKKQFEKVKKVKSILGEQ
jgi:CRISPR-associated protein Csm5